MVPLPLNNLRFLLLTWVSSFLLMTSSPSAVAFIAPATTRVRSTELKKVSYPHTRPLHLSNPQQFDLTKPQFDPLSFRAIRSDALLQYDTLNQSEPLRINLYGLLTLCLFAFPTVSEAVLGEKLDLVGTAASILGGVGSCGLFVRECGRRSRQLSRIEKELNAEFLSVKVPTNPFADRSVGEVVKLKQLRGKRRILALCGTKDKLKDAMVEFRVLRRRLIQASVVAICVPTDGSTRADWGLERDEGRGWLGEVSDATEWLDYFRTLSDERGGGKELVWFGLTNSGRSFGSGAGEAPRLMEVLGQSLRPVEVLDVDDKAERSGGGAEEVLSSQGRFYETLTKGSLSAMGEVYAAKEAGEVTEVVDGGGRIDAWELCLKDEARPAGMKISGSDVLVVSDSEAYSTAIEFPPDAGIESATLLAVQRWIRESGDGEWKLQLHKTIPWSPDSRAQGTLRCDCRGCVALTRGPERRTFGGLIG